MSSLVDRLIEVAIRVPTPLRLVALAAWAGIIFLASNQPGLAISDDPGVDRPFRHGAHVVVYAVLTVLLVWALTGRRLPSPGLAIGCGMAALLYGVTDEWHQTMVPTRSGRAEDLVWDGLGAALAVGAVLLVRTRAERRRMTGG